MAQIPPRPDSTIRITRSAELAKAPRLVVHFGTAPDGLPWLLSVNRSDRLNLLFQTVLSVFDVKDRQALPDSVRRALENDVAAGLMGVHPIALDGQPAVVYVSRRKAKQILGQTLLSQILEGVAPRHAPAQDSGAMTNVGATAATTNPLALEAVERSIEERKSKRHLVLQLAGGAALTGAVSAENRALQSPRPPYRPLAFESLGAIGDVRAKFVSSAGQIWQVPLSDRQHYAETLSRMHHNPHGGSLVFEVPRIELVQSLAVLARDVARLHARGLVHADLAPGNVLLAERGPVSFDALEVAIGSPAMAATFEWAAPEQIVGQPVDARTDVFAIGRMLAAILGAVPFGEETRYVVPIGGGQSRRVELLKTEGVFIDILGTRYDRAWQVAWQAFLGRAIAYDRARRPEDAGAMADELLHLVDRFPPRDHLDCPGQFGTPVPMDTDDGWTFARLVSD